ncbi:MerR family transcriptional regulator [Methylibium sp.]|jgi:DNA-binding transcriptional MerR regulator|uniref:MerR family transcriptional regulator n=1 Tax=Methylibium sp. TaxID=2067992 RepID=UPI0033402F45
MEKSLPPIPAKRYFTIGEVSELCGVKPYVLRYWEQEFSQLKPMKRRGNRRYYQHHEVLLIRRIRELLYEQGFTISGARNRLSEAGVRAALAAEAAQAPADAGEGADGALPVGEGLPEIETMEAAAVAPTASVARVRVNAAPPTLATMRDELVSIRQLLLP